MVATIIKCNSLWTDNVVVIKRFYVQIWDAIFMAKMEASWRYGIVGLCVGYGRVGLVCYSQFNGTIYKFMFVKDSDNDISITRHLISSAGRLNNNVDRHRMFVLGAAMMTADRPSVELPLAKVIRISLAETLKVTGKQHKCSLNYLQAALRALQQQHINRTLKVTGKQHKRSLNYLQAALRALQQQHINTTRPSASCSRGSTTAAHKHNRAFCKLLSGLYNSST